MTFAESGTITTTVTIPIPDCPQPVWHGLSSGPLTGIIIAGLLLVIACVVATAIVRYHGHDEKTARHRVTAQTNLELAKYHKTCLTCSTPYEPEMKK